MNVITKDEYELRESNVSEKIDSFISRLFIFENKWDKINHEKVMTKIYKSVIKESYPFLGKILACIGIYNEFIIKELSEFDLIHKLDYGVGFYEHSKHLGSDSAILKNITEEWTYSLGTDLNMSSFMYYNEILQDLNLYYIDDSYLGLSLRNYSHEDNISCPHMNDSQNLLLEDIFYESVKNKIIMSTEKENILSARYFDIGGLHYDK